MPWRPGNTSKYRANHAAEFEIDGEIFTIQNCRLFAETVNKPADIIDAILRTFDNRFIRVTTVPEGSVAGHPETRQGWYVASFIEVYDAHLLRGELGRPVRAAVPEPAGRSQ